LGCGIFSLFVLFVLLSVFFFGGVDVSEGLCLVEFVLGCVVFVFCVF